MPQSRHFNLSNQGKDFSSGSGKKNYLFVVGINTYEHHPELNNCVRDAEGIINVLTQQYQFDYEKLVALYDKDATREAIWDQLDIISKQINESDNLLLYFACHGYWRKEDQTGFLVPYDGKENSATLIRTESIKNHISRSKAHHVFLVVDACFSGSVFRSINNPKTDTGKKYAERVDRFASRYGLAAGRIEKVADGIVGNHSPFTKSMIHFLQNTPDSIFTVNSLIEHVKSTVVYGAKQTPIGGVLDQTGHQDGEFVFRRKPRKELNLRLKNSWKYLGRHDKLSDKHKWEWSVFLDDANSGDIERVASVEYVLHSSFPNPRRLRTNKNRRFKLKTNGWGEFTITAFLNLKGGEKIELKHDLMLRVEPPTGITQ